MDQRDLKTETDEGNTFRLTEFLVKTEYAPQTLEDLRPCTCQLFKYFMDNKGRNWIKKKKTYYSPLRNRGESRSRSPRQKSLGRQQGWKVILNWTEPRVVIWTKSWKVYLSHITVGPYVVMWLFDEHLSPPLEHKLLQRVMGSVCCIHYCIPNA